MPGSPGIDGDDQVMDPLPDPPCIVCSAGPSVCLYLKNGIIKSYLFKGPRGFVGERGLQGPQGIRLEFLTCLIMCINKKLCLGEVSAF